MELPKNPIAHIQSQPLKHSQSIWRIVLIYETQTVTRLTSVSKRPFW